MKVSASVEARLDWDYAPSAPRVRALYEQAKQFQWNASTALDWSIEVPFGQALPADSAAGMRRTFKPKLRFSRTVMCG